MSDTNGKPLSRVNDLCTCPCKGHGPTTPIVSGDPTFIIDGQPAARHNDMTACGAYLIASQVVTFVDSGAVVGTALLSVNTALLSAGVALLSAGATQSATSVTSREEADQHFVLFDETTQTPLRDRLYRLHLNGAVSEGRTDADGRTKLVRGNLDDQVKIEVFAEDAGA